MDPISKTPAPQPEIRRLEQEMMEARLRAEERERQISLIISSAPDAIFIQTEGCFSFVNPRALELFGAETEQQLLGQPVLERFHPDYRKGAAERIRGLNREKKSQSQLEEVLLRLDGTPVYGEVSGVPFRFDGKDGALVFVRDITERKAHQQELDRHHEILDNLLAQVPGVVYQYRLWPDGRSAFPIASPGMREIYAVSPEEVRQDASPVFTRLHPEDADDIVRTINDSARDLTPYKSEFRVILPDGKLCWRHCDAKPERLPDGSTLWYGIITDITERKQAEEELRTRNEEINSFFDSAIDLLCVAGLDGRFLRLNREWESVLGYPLAELEGSLFLDLVHPEDRADTLDAVRQLREGDEVTRFSNRYRCRDGSYRWIEWKSRSDGSKIYAAARDITERIEKDRALLEAKTRAEESDRLKTAFLQNISHEIRTPMNGIIGFSEMLQDTDLGDTERNEFLRIITGSSRQLLSIVDDILSISTLESRQEKLITGETDLNRTLEALHSVFESQARNRNISLTYAGGLDGGRCRIITDGRKLKRILSNLIGNALKFTHQGTVMFGYLPMGNQLDFFVKDSGIGVEPELQEKIFERFFQGEMEISRKFGGTGLGLSIARGLVELMGGDLTVRSEPGKGSCFNFTIPWNPVVSPEAEGPGQICGKDCERVILVAEDEDLNYMLIERMLKTLPVRLIRARTGEEAVELCRLEETVDLVLMDIKMPGMDGYTASRLIRKLRSNLSIVAQTAFALDDELVRNGDCFDAFITKPVSVDQFRDTVIRFLPGHPAYQSVSR